MESIQDIPVNQPLQPNSPETTSRKSNFIIFLLGIVLFTLMIGGAYYLGTQSKIYTPLYPLVTKAPDNVITPTIATDLHKDCIVTSCHGLDITCGFRLEPINCTTSFEAGDSCRSLARCEVKNGTCQPVLDEKFTTCKSCVNNCQSLYSGPDNYENYFNCESKCYSSP